MAKAKYDWFENHEDELSFTVRHTEDDVETIIAITDTSEKAHLIATRLNGNALHLVAEGDFVNLNIEDSKGVWLALIRERLDSPFSHIIEPAGIRNIID